MQDADADNTDKIHPKRPIGNKCFFFNCYFMLMLPRECKQQSDKDKGKERRETQVKSNGKKRQKATEAGREITTK